MFEPLVLIGIDIDIDIGIDIDINIDIIIDICFPQVQALEVPAARDSKDVLRGTGCICIALFVCSKSTLEWRTQGLFSGCANFGTRIVTK
jgi:hypothetical protein